MLFLAKRVQLEADLKQQIAEKQARRVGICTKFCPHQFIGQEGAAGGGPKAADRREAGSQGTIQSPSPYPVSAQNKVLIYS